MTDPYSDHVHPFARPLPFAQSQPTDPTSEGPTSPPAPATTSQPIDESTPIPFAAVQPTTPTPTSASSAMPGSTPIPMSTPIANPATEQATRIVSDLQTVAQRIKSAINEKLAEFDLNDVRYAVLSFVRDSAAEGCSQSMLADRLRQSESSISTLVDRMRTSGLLYRLRSKTDRRKRYLAVTERGRTLLTAVDAHYGETVDRVLRGLGSEDRSTLARLLEQMMLHLDDGASEDTPASRPLAA